MASLQERAWWFLLQDWKLVALQVALPAAFICAGWRTAIAFSEIVNEGSYLDSDRNGKIQKSAWWMLLVTKAKEEGIFLVWYVGSSLVLFLLHAVGLVRLVASLRIICHEKLTSLQGFDHADSTRDFVLLKANGYLIFFSIYISFVRLLCIPFLIVAKAWSDESCSFNVNNSAEVNPSVIFLALC